jgi:hypothetical protein
MTSSSAGFDSVGFIVVIGAICVIAVISNIIVVVLTCRRPSGSHVATNLFIVNLAVSDIILGGVTMPLILLDANIPDFMASK